MPRDWRAGDNSNREPSHPREPRPDRLALWAVLLAVFSMIVAAASAHAASGGVSSGGGTAAGSNDPSSPTTESAFGSRILRVGMEGDDVRVLNGIVKSKSYSGGVRIDTTFEQPTKEAVEEFQSEAGLPSNGVVNEATSQALTRSMERAAATWYGPGFYGNRTACGKTLTPDMLGVANRSLPCGSKVTLRYRGRSVTVPVIDRGPYAGDREYDLTAATKARLRFPDTGTLLTNR
jgi:rare lipoprotein A (peptidoglycan hydrolase)